jgi:hypothetical protein
VSQPNANKLSDRDLRGPFRDTMTVHEDTEKYIDELQDLKDDISMRINSYGVHREEWRTLAVSELHQSMSFLSTSASNAKARILPALNRLEDAVAVATDTWEKVHSEWNALWSEIGRRSAYAHFYSSRLDTLQRALADVARAETCERETFLNAHADWLRERDATGIYASLSASKLANINDTPLSVQQPNNSDSESDLTAAHMRGPTHQSNKSDSESVHMCGPTLPTDSLPDHFKRRFVHACICSDTQPEGASSSAHDSDSNHDIGGKNAPRRESSHVDNSASMMCGEYSCLSLSESEFRGEKDAAALVMKARSGTCESDEVKALRDKCAVSESEKEKLQQIVDILREKLSESESERTQLQQHTDSMVQETITLRQQLSESESQKSKLQQSMDDVAQETDTLRQQLSESESQKSKLQQGMDQVAQETAALREQVQAYEKEKALAVHYMDAAHSDIEEKDMRNDQAMQAMIAEIASLKQELQSARACLAACEHEMQALKQEFETKIQEFFRSKECEAAKNQEENRLKIHELEQNMQCKMHELQDMQCKMQELQQDMQRKIHEQEQNMRCKMQEQEEDMRCKIHEHEQDMQGIIHAMEMEVSELRGKLYVYEKEVGAKGDACGDEETEFGHQVCMPRVYIYIYII